MRTWRDVLFELQDHLADPYLAAVEDDFTRHMLGRLLADKQANVNALVVEYRKLKGVLTCEEHQRQIERERLLKANGF